MAHPLFAPMFPVHTLAAAVVFLAGCTTSPAPAEPVARPTVAADSLDLPPVDRATLTALFGPAGAEAALDYDRAFRAVGSSEDLKAVYDQAFALSATLLDPVFEDDAWNVDAFVETDLGLAGLLPSCAAECTAPVFELNLAQWAAAAQHAGDEGAVEFFDALAMVYDFPDREEYAEDYEGLTNNPSVLDGELLGWPAYRTQTWDYGGYSNLGSGIHERLLTAFASMSLEGPFEDDLRSLREGVALDVIEATCIGPSAAQAIAETRRINDSLVAPDIAQTTYDLRVEALENLETSDMEVGCADPDAECDCVGG